MNWSTWSVLFQVTEAFGVQVTEALSSNGCVRQTLVRDLRRDETDSASVRPVPMGHDAPPSPPMSVLVVHHTVTEDRRRQGRLFVCVGVQVMTRDVCVLRGAVRSTAWGAEWGGLGSCGGRWRQLIADVPVAPRGVAVFSRAFVGTSYNA